MEEDPPEKYIIVISVDHEEEEGYLQDTMRIYIKSNNYYWLNQGSWVVLGRVLNSTFMPP